MLLRHRWVHFVLLGALLFASIEWFAAGPAAPLRLEISPESYHEMRREAARRLGREPRETELEGFLEGLITEEILVREARARRFDRDDPVVRRRLLQNMRFLVGSEDRSEEELLLEAMELGLGQSDLVVRRRLAQRMRLVIEGKARGAQPSESELERYLEQERDRFNAPGRLRFRQLFYDPARREDAGADATRALTLPGRKRLESGDPLPLGFAGWVSEEEISRRLGPEFARRLFEVEGDDWAGPLRSPYGFHIVRVKDRRPPAMPALQEVRERVRLGLLAERGEQAVRDQVGAWRSKYEIVIPQQ